MREPCNSYTLIIECPEKIACDVCEDVCRKNVISLDGSSINIPRITGMENCSACGLCVAHCPGHSVFLIDNTYSPQDAKITVPFELSDPPTTGSRVYAVDEKGVRVGKVTVIKIKAQKSYNKTRLLELSAAKDMVSRVRGIEHVS
jgi:formate hydrogenlyase subunit 6/NADH:ubiquinone oxidoreductase subunit I